MVLVLDNNNGIESFSNELSNIIQNLIQDPRCSASDLEPWPHKSYNPEFEFRKYRFNAPLLSGSARSVICQYICPPFFAIKNSHNKFYTTTNYEEII